jgi:DNA-directed RNA polymerase subunit beta'
VSFYFIDPTTLGEGGLKEYFENEELIEPFNKKFLGNIIAEVAYQVILRYQQHLL